MLTSGFFQTDNNNHSFSSRAMADTDIANFDWSEAFSSNNKADTIENCKSYRESGLYSFPTDDPNFRKAAVLVPLCYDILGTPSLLYNLRSLNLSRDKGDISFPGGIMETGDDNSPIITALRETEEELGLKRENVEIWGLLRDFQTSSASLGVTPVVGFVHGLKKLDPTKLKINPAEVDHAFTVSLEHLCNSKNWAEIENKTFGISVPAYTNLNVRSGSQIVDLWGLTAEITDLTLKALLPKVYKRKVSFLDALVSRTNS